MLTSTYFHHLYDLLHRKMPFYGSGLEESLERIPEEHLHETVGHRTIAQLLEHMLVWRQDLAKRLLGEPREKIVLNTPQDWPAPSGKTKAEYLAEFVAITARIKQGIDAFDYAKLEETLHPDYDYTSVDLLEGSAHHDIYHLGQINLIAAMLKNR
ncbi:MAG: DinB family protein [Bacteroidota bacterium]